eukprot:TRINITY_DN224_c0_g5_i1.p2 TRINITY_DN224_c0_g5~~TRINITY_DN224_c0_g5_i1.p2  ORF type:complete len:708 (+),score=148.81 TRINITY_DN224_c0_g5_i1:2100-4223(+)
MSYPKKSQVPKQDKSAASTSSKVLLSKKRDQLKNLLVGKFKSKYAASLKSVNLDAFISNEVEKFLAQGNLTEPNLAKLDQKINEAIKAKVNPKAPPKATAEASSKPLSPGPSENAPASPPNIQPTESDPIISDVWGCIVEYNKKLHEEERLTLAAKQKEMKSKLKQDLDKQMEEKHRLQAEQTKRERELEERQVKLETELQQKDKAKEQKMKELALKQKLEAQELFERMFQTVNKNPIGERAKKQQELMKEKAAEQEQVKKIQEELDREYTKTGRKKQPNRELEQVMLKALEENKRKQEEEKRRELIEEEKMAKEMEEIAKRGKLHQEELLKKKKEQMKLLEKAAENTAQIVSKPGPKDKLIAKTDVTSLPIEDKANIEKVAKLKKETVNTLKKQVEDKKMKELEEKRYNEKLAEQWRKEANEHKQKEKVKAEQSKKVLYENKEILRSQMEEKKQKAKQQVGKDELLINKQLLEKAKEVVISRSPKSMTGSPKLQQWHCLLFQAFIHHLQHFIIRLVLQYINIVLPQINYGDNNTKVHSMQRATRKVQVPQVSCKIVSLGKHNFFNSCSAKCYKEHKKLHESEPVQEVKQEVSEQEEDELYLSDDDIILGQKDYDKLCMSIIWLTIIVSDDQIRTYVRNKRLAKAVREVDQSFNRKKALETALKDPDFKEFADHCLKALNLLDESGQFTYDQQRVDELVLFSEQYQI